MSCRVTKVWATLGFPHRAMLPIGDAQTIFKHSEMSAVPVTNEHTPQQRQASQPLKCVFLLHYGRSKALL